jgi:uncharacterized cupin superfamily protein
MAEPVWEPFDPKDNKAGPVEYPDELTGRVQWVRTFTEGPMETENGSIGISICHMQGDATPMFEATFAEGQNVTSETEIITFLEGSAEVRFPDGHIEHVDAPKVVMLPRGVRYDWRYLTPYRAVYTIIW